MYLRPIPLFIILLSLELFAARDSTQTKTNIAVSDLAGQGIDGSTAAVITDRLRSELFNTGTVTVLERSQMQEILKEQGFQQAGCTTDQCAVETGQMLGVKYMVVGSIGLVGHTYTIASRLIDVSTGRMTATANVDCRCEIDDVLSRSTVEISRKLARSFSPLQNNESPKPAAAAPSVVETGSLKISSNPISAGGTEGRNYTLKTLPVSRQQGKTAIKHSPVWLKITLAAGANVAACAGFLCDNVVKTETNDCTNIAAAYAVSGSNISYAPSRQKYSDHYNKAKNYSLYRDVLYGAAGALIAGFAVSFAF
jgi:TolB-like protein